MCVKKADTLVLTEDNISCYEQIPNMKEFAENYRNTVLIKVLEYYAGKNT